MTIGLPNFLDRPDRVRACTERHVGACDVCGFNGVHTTWVQPLERRQFRGACACAWYGPIRQPGEGTYSDRVGHRRERTTQ